MNCKLWFKVCEQSLCFMFCGCVVSGFVACQIGSKKPEIRLVANGAFLYTNKQLMFIVPEIIYFYVLS